MNEGGGGADTLLFSPRGTLRQPPPIPPKMRRETVAIRPGSDGVPVTSPHPSRNQQPGPPPRSAPSPHSLTTPTNPHPSSSPPSKNSLSSASSGAPTSTTLPDPQTTTTILGPSNEELPPPPPSQEADQPEIEEDAESVPPPRVTSNGETPIVVSVEQQLQDEEEAGYEDGEGFSEDNDNLNSGEQMLNMTPEEKLKHRREKIAFEILSTERSYVAALNIVVNQYMEPLRAAAGKGGPINKIEHINSIFGNVKGILEVNSSFLEELEILVEQNWSDTQCIGSLFVKMVPKFWLYMSYVSEYKTSILMLNKYEKRNNFIDFSQKVQSVTPQKQHLSGLLIQPVQRIPRYRLLLEELVAKTPQEHPDYQNLQKAAHEISAIAKCVDKQMDKEENLMKICRIQQSFIGNVKTLIKPNRIFIREGPLKMLTTSSGVVKRWFFMFNDSLVMASVFGADKMEAKKKSVHQREEKSNRRYNFRRMILFETDDFRIKDAQDTVDLKNSFQMISSLKSFVVMAKSPEEKKAWMDDIAEQLTKLEDFRKRKGGAIEQKDAPKNATPISLDSVDINDTEGSGAPVWTPDKYSTICQMCASSFTVMRRRHHCRNCGKLVCASCSSHRRKLTKLKMEKEVRVCTFCNDWLQQTAKDEGGEEDASNGYNSSQNSFGREPSMDKDTTSNGTNKEKEKAGSLIKGFIQKPSLGRLNSVKQLAVGGGFGNNGGDGGDKKKKKGDGGAGDAAGNGKSRKPSDPQAFSYELGGGGGTLERGKRYYYSSPNLPLLESAAHSDSSVPTRKTIFGRKKKTPKQEDAGGPLSSSLLTDNGTVRARRPSVVAALPPYIGPASRNPPSTPTGNSPPSSSTQHGHVSHPPATNPSRTPPVHSKPGPQQQPQQQHHHTTTWAKPPPAKSDTMSPPMNSKESTTAFPTRPPGPGGGSGIQRPAGNTAESNTAGMKEASGPTFTARLPGGGSGIQRSNSIDATPPTLLRATAPGSPSSAPQRPPRPPRPGGSNSNIF